MKIPPTNQHFSVLFSDILVTFQNNDTRPYSIHWLWWILFFQLNTTGTWVQNAESGLHSSSHANSFRDQSLGIKTISNKLCQWPLLLNFRVSFPFSFFQFRNRVRFVESALSHPAVDKVWRPIEVRTGSVLPTSLLRLASLNENCLVLTQLTLTDLVSLDQFSAE